MTPRRIDSRGLKRVASPVLVIVICVLLAASIEYLRARPPTWAWQVMNTAHVLLAGRETTPQSTIGTDFRASSKNVYFAGGTSASGYFVSAPFTLPEGTTISSVHVASPGTLTNVSLLPASGSAARYTYRLDEHRVTMLTIWDTGEYIITVSGRGTWTVELSF